MEYTNLGRSTMTVSKICLGTMHFGPKASEEESHKILDKAMEMGIMFIDTANVYGAGAGKGRSEEIIGNWLATRPGVRDEIVLATKVYNSMSSFAAPNEGPGFSAYRVRKHLADSLRRLQTDHIDLYQMHHVDLDTPWDEIWQAMETLVAQGKVIYVGSSNFAGWHISQAQEAAKARHFYGLSSEQSIYNLLERTVELEVLPACTAYGLGVIPWSPLMGGLLGGILRKEREGRAASEQTQNRLAEYRDKVEAYEAFCDELGESPADVGIAWLLHQPAVTAPIIGPRTMEQLDGSLRALEITLSEKELARLDEISPGPGGPAPQAYAW